MTENTTKLYILRYNPSSGGMEESMVIRAHSREEALNIAKEFDAHELSKNYIRARNWKNASCQELSQTGECWVITSEDSKDDLRAEADNNPISHL